jgi:pyruvate/2-oxoglutarate dehydrogenase complex dihydrolipoamide dehydrogenase (E3) component
MDTPSSAPSAQAQEGAGAYAPSSHKLAKYMPVKVCVFGSGSFGTAMGTVLARNGHEVWILTRRKDVELKITVRSTPCHLFNPYSVGL